MRACAILCPLLALVLAAGILRGDDLKKGDADRIANLIRQLGHDEYLKREAANQELESIGEPALAALREAANVDEDAEIRQRARELIPTITTRSANEDLKKLQGTWTLVSGEADGKPISAEDKTVTFTISGTHWVTRHGGTISDQGALKFVDLSGQLRRVDLIGVGGGISYAIFQVEDDVLRYCRHAVADARANDFTTKMGDGRNSTVWKRLKP